MFRKLKLLVLSLIITLLGVLFTYLSSQDAGGEATEHQKRVAHSETDKSNELKHSIAPKASVAAGQWVLYEVNTNQLGKAAKNNSYLLKISLVGEEIIEGKTYFWEEVSLVSQGITIKSLKDRLGGKPTRVIFQRNGFPAVELDPKEIKRVLNIESPLQIIPEIPLVSPISSSPNANPDIITPKKVNYTLPFTKRKIVCQELVYNDTQKGGQVIIWASGDIPLSGFTQLTAVSKGSIVSVNLVDFGLTGASSVIKGKVLKFGEVYRD